MKIYDKLFYIIFYKIINASRQHDDLSVHKKYKFHQAQGSM